jgi:DNA topoisomerase-3
VRSRISGKSHLLHDLPSLQKLCGSRFGWSASKTLEVAQELYDGQGKKIVTYPRAEVRYLPQSLISDVPRITAGLRVGQSFGAIPVPEPPVIRRGASGTFYDKGLEGASHHAVIPNVNAIDKLPEVWPRLSSDGRDSLTDAGNMAALMPDFRYRQPQLSMRGFELRAADRRPIDLGWQPHSRSNNRPTKGQRRICHYCATGDCAARSKIETRKPAAAALQLEGAHRATNAWRFVDDEVLRDACGSQGYCYACDPAEIIAAEAGFPIAGERHCADRTAYRWRSQTRR